MNRQNLPYKLKVTHLAQHTRQEFRGMLGRKTTPFHKRSNFGRKDVSKEDLPKDIPKEINWRLRGILFTCNFK